ncbi:uncharacterized protein C20orf194-like [Lytechinus variegatus]|uniref:uncharacterized protein C20orf194-like n=1 Tax=Lytechinus variegatus TaxID=7654 RepID=UPI001BB2BEBB|nr:uncharacterized protein C20orf194-like [Lytechinus variegatus]
MPPKRPSSARRNIKHVTFSPFVSCARLRHVQSLLRNPGEVDSSKPDAILCILGIDSRYNEGSRELSNYLLFGFFDTRQAELESSGFAEETIDDLMFVIKKNSVHIYCNPTNYYYILPYVAHWPGLRFHLMTESEYDEEEAAEEFKIVSFLDMVRGCALVGVPYFAKGHCQPFNPMFVEKWPIVQAYGLEGYATGGFFTMMHEVIDISSPLASVYDIVDPVALETIVTNQLPLFERQWSSLLTNVDVSYKAKAFSTLLEGMVGEPLKSYYSHGKVSNSSNNEGQSGRKPYVLFGQNSMKAHMKVTQEGGFLPGKTLHISGVGDTPAKHMICQLVAPRSPLCCARTYFTSSGHAPYPITGGSAQAPRPPKTDIELLERLYKVVIGSVLASINEYCKTTSYSKAEACCLSSLKEGFTEEHLKLGPGFLTNKANIDFTLEALTQEGNTIELRDDKVPLIKLVSLVVYDIPSVEHPNNSLGSVVFAESFLDSAIPVLQKDGSIEMNAECLILTRHLPRTVTWAADMKPSDIENNISLYTKNPESPFGSVLLHGVNCTMLGSVELSAPSDGVLYVFEKGIIFSHPRNGLTILPKSYYEELHFYDGGSSSVLACLMITYRHSLQYYQPLQNHNAGDMVMFAFPPKTNAYRMLYKEVIGRWQQENQSPVLKQLDAMPEYYTNTYNELQHNFVTDARLQKQVPSLTQASVYLSTLNSFLTHLSVSSVDPDPVHEADLPSILDPTTEQSQNSSDADEVVITLLTGITGSHKETLCTTLTNLAKDYNRWAVLRAPFGVPHAYKKDQLEASLTNIVTAARRQKASIRASTGGRKKMRVLIMTPGFTDTVSVVSAILNHPNPDIRGSLKIGAVTTCIDPLQAFMEHRMTFPLLLDQCAQGWVNNILLTSCTEGPHPELMFIQELMRKVNSDVAFILANYGEISRSGDAELILSETAFMEPSKVRARHLLIPQWSSPEFRRQLTPIMTEVSLKFSQPLDRSRLLTKIRSLRSSLVSSPFKGNIYHIEARTRFNESNQLMELTFSTLSGHLTECPAPELPAARPPSGTPRAPLPPGAATNGPPTEAGGDNNGHEGPQHCFMFTGCGLKEDDLKDWLRACATPKPTPKALKTKSSLNAAEKKQIHEKHHLASLPAGWFYNGSQYVSMTGEKTNTHPEMDKFISEFVEKSNIAIKEYNDGIAAQEYRDLFQ